jgi:NTE family protein
MRQVDRVTKPKKVALVIGSGNVKCAAALGLWKVLHRERIDINMYVGCSGGSLFASTMALGYDVDESIAITQSLWNRTITAKKDWSSLLRAFVPLLSFDERFGMIDDRAMMRSLEIVFGEETFRDARTPLFIMATDFHSGEPSVFQDGRLLDAIRASITLPYIWKPWKIGDRYYVDGSLSNPMPVDVAIKEGADVILAVGFENPFPKEIKSVTRFAFHIDTIMTNNLLRANFAFQNLAHHAEIVSIFPEFDRPINLFSTDQIPYVIEQGERSMEDRLPYLLQILEEMPSQV